jgi:2-phosphosulfolactate phosphatase
VTTPISDFSAESQHRYQVRFDVGCDGAWRIGESAHLLVWCDALATMPVPLDALPAHLQIIDARFGAAAVIAQQLLAVQAARGERTMVAVIAAAARGSAARGSAAQGIPIEDNLLAGAMVDALGAVGIDATSPEAAVEAAAFQGLRGAVGHLITASVGGQAFAAERGPEAMRAARARWESSDLVVVRRGEMPV